MGKYFCLYYCDDTWESAEHSQYFVTQYILNNFMFNSNGNIIQTVDMHINVVCWYSYNYYSQKSGLFIHSICCDMRWPTAVMGCFNFLSEAVLISIQS